MEHVLVTGGAGYIGSLACKLLATQGYVPVTLDSHVKGWSSAVRFGDASTIYGMDYPTPDGTCVRHYVHRMDLVDGHIKGLDWLLEGKGSRAINLGTGRVSSVKEVVAECTAATGHDVPHVFDPGRAGYAAALVSGSRRAAEELGWSPERSTLQHMIADAWRWYQTGGYSG